MSDQQPSVYTRFCLASGISVFLLYASLFVVSDLLFMAGLPLSFFHSACGFGIWLLISRVILKKFGLSFTTVCVAWIFSILLLFTAGKLSAQVLDTSFDSQWYHMNAVYKLADGWNPYARALSQNEGYTLYLNHFPKSIWIIEANLYKLSGHLESAKCTTWLLMVAIFFLSEFIFTVLFRLKRSLSLLLSLLLAFNPVSFMSSLTFYVDGQVSALFLLVCLFAGAYFMTKQQAWLFLSLLANAVLANSKLPAAVYAFLLFAGIFMLSWYLRTEPVKQLFLKIFLAGFLTYAVLGFHPFITNWKTTGHLLYPATSTENMPHLVSDSYPANFKGKNRFERFGMSLMGKPQWSYGPDSIHSKTLFGHTNLSYYGDGLIESGAWGPMFPEILVLLLPCFLVAVFIHRKEKTTWYVCGFILFILLTVFINPEAWLARYVPQFWLVVAATVFLLSRFRVFNILAAVFAVLLLFNIYMMGRTYVTAATDRSIAQRTLLLHLLEKKEVYEIDPGWTLSMRYRLGEFGFDTASFTKFNWEDSNYTFIDHNMKAAYRLKQQEK